MSPQSFPPTLLHSKSVKVLCFSLLHSTNVKVLHFSLLLPNLYNLEGGVQTTDEGPLLGGHKQHLVVIVQLNNLSRWFHQQL